MPNLFLKNSNYYFYEELLTTPNLKVEYQKVAILIHVNNMIQVVLSSC